MTSTRLRAAHSQAWETMAQDYGLFPQLPLDAALARAAEGEAAEAVPRLLDLLTGAQLPVEEAPAITDFLRRNRWADDQRVVIEEVLDAWWLETLMQEPGEHVEPFVPGTVLGLIVGYGAPMVRWFEPWLEQLDGPGAAHLAAIVQRGLDGPAWDGKQDQAAQVLGWARTETVINGLTLIGGVHLPDDVLSDVLDRLI